MPIYEYFCKECDVKIDKFFKTIKDGENYLPICSCKNTMVKLISSSSFQLKGDGWFSKQKGDSND